MTTLYPIDLFGFNTNSALLATPAFGFDSCQPANRRATRVTGKQMPVQFAHPQAGVIRLQGYALPHMQVTGVHWTPTTTLHLYDPTPFKTISAGFVLEGRLDAQMKGFRHSLTMRAQTHTFVHTPETGHLNQLTGGEDLRMLLIDIEPDFFLAAIGQGDRWTDKIADDLHHERPFIGGADAPAITPPMRCLIQSILSCQTEGPMQNLLIQSRVLELVALQIEQFRNVAPATDALPAEDVDKLRALKAYLDSHFLLDHSLAQLSRHCGLNEFKVKKGFKKLFNTTVFDYLRRRRMDYACQLLRDQTRLVDEVAQQLGYEHSHHFAVAFRKYTGLLPSHYQQGRAIRLN